MAENAPDLVGLHEPEGTFLFVSPSCLAHLGYLSAELAGGSFFALFHPDDQEPVRQEWSGIRAGAAATGSFTYRMRRKNGEYAWFETRVRPVADEGVPARWVQSVSREMPPPGRATLGLGTPRAGAGSREDSPETLLHRIAGNSPLAFYVFNAHTGEIIYFNRRFCELWNLEDLEALRRRGELKAQDIVPRANLMLREAGQYALEPAADGGDEAPEAEYALVDGRTICRFASVVRNEENAYFAHLYLYEDITGRRLADDKIRENQAGLAEAQRIARVGSWTLNLDTQAFSASAETQRILGLDVARTSSTTGLPPDGTGPVLTFTDMIRKIHPDDVKAFIECIENTLDRGDPCDLTFRTVPSDQEVKHVRCQANPVRNPDGSLKALTGIIHDITQQKRTEEQLIAAKELAERSVRIKEEFLANMSHEIRTPLNGIVGMTHLLSQTELSAEQQQFMGAIRFSTDSLMVIINDILDLAKIESGMLQIESIPLDVRQVLRDVTSLFRIKTQEKGVEIFTKVADNVPQTLLGDSVRLNQILLNLIGNAVKFTQQGFIGVSLHCNESNAEHTEVVFSVKDTGIGIGENKLGMVFDSFTQATGDTTRRYGGTGLGLAICKKLVELQGGRISVSSQLGRGSEFTFFIRYPKGMPAHPRPAAVTDQGPPPVLPETLRILLAEDNEINRLILLTMLDKWPRVAASVDVATNGLEVLDLLREGDYDLILMDCQMPRMDGYTATRCIRGEMAGWKARIPIIAITASALKHDEERVFECGMNDFIPKPFEPQQLFEKIIRAVTTSQVTASGTVAYDLTLLREITGDNSETFVTIIEKFLEKTPLEIGELTESVDQRDYPRMARIVHRLKSTARFLGLSALGELLDEMEEEGQAAGSDPDPKRIRYQAAQVRSAFGQILEGLRAELRKLGPDTEGRISPHAAD
ncbi:MAG: PAS domain-containing protein [Ferruginibacter sp.]|nr:PAS domain-containing protein [Cytophagales bacterium]